MSPTCVKTYHQYILTDDFKFEADSVTYLGPVPDNRNKMLTDSHSEVMAATVHTQHITNCSSLNCCPKIH